MPGEMSQMITVRPNAGAVRHYDRCGVIRRPRVGCFVPIVAHCVTPTDVAAESLEYPHGVRLHKRRSLRSRALFSWRRFSHEGARRSRVAVQVWPWFETLAPSLQHPRQPCPELRLGVWLHAARISGRFRDIPRVCKDEFLCSRSWHAWRHPDASRIWEFQTCVGVFELRSG